MILVGLFASASTKFNVLFGTQKDIDAIVETLKTQLWFRCLVNFLLLSRIRQRMFLLRNAGFYGMFMVFMNISLAISNTRAEEDSGLLEMVRSRTVGCLAPTYATVIEILLINGLMGILYVASLIAADLNGATPQGDLLMGVSIASIGIMFGFISLLLAQLANNSRSANFYELWVVWILLYHPNDDRCDKS